MNEQLRQRAQEIADEHCNDAYSVALAMLEREAKLDNELESEINARDAYHEWCDELANEISSFLGVEVGEHSSENSPWLNAYEAIPESLAKVKAEAVREAKALLIGNGFASAPYMLDDLIEELERGEA